MFSYFRKGSKPRRSWKGVEVAGLAALRRYGVMRVQLLRYWDSVARSNSDDMLCRTYFWMEEISHSIPILQSMEFLSGAWFPLSTAEIL